MAYNPFVVIVETRSFTTRLKTLLDDDQYRGLQALLAGRPDQGDVIPGTGGLRKLRWSGSGRGKRGGIRIIYFWHQRTARILMLLAYAKNERDDLTPSQKRALRHVIETEYP
jgi:mRNA-degrading endonuclease RelE of RelBE toxin-antitoxin system